MRSSIKKGYNNRIGQKTWADGKTRAEPEKKVGADFDCFANKPELRAGPDKGVQRNAACAAARGGVSTIRSAKEARVDGKTRAKTEKKARANSDCSANRKGGHLLKRI